jgi:hypothetical protein
LYCVEKAGENKWEKELKLALCQLSYPSVMFEGDGFEPSTSRTCEVAFTTTTPARLTKK